MTLVGPHRGVDPAVVEESLDSRSRLAREIAVRLGDDAARLLPGRLRRVVGDRREAVVVLELVEPEELRLEAVVPLWHVVARGGGVDERLHGGVGRLVREVARRDPGRVAAEPVVDPLVHEDRVEDRRAGAKARLESHGDGLGGAAALVAIRRVELRHSRLERDRLRLALEADAKRAEHLLVEARPGRDAGDGLLGDDLLLGLGQQIRAEDALRREPVAPVVERRVGEQLLGRLVLDRGPLEPEEEELRLEARTLLTELCHERTARLVGHVRGEVHVREVESARRDRFDPLALVDRRGEVGRGEARDVAVVPVAEGRGGNLGLGEVALRCAGHRQRRRGRRGPTQPLRRRFAR